MKKILTILLISTLFAGELEVDGDLTVTGNIQNQTIDSLLQVIADLQSQLSALQIENRLETRIYEYQADLPEHIDVDFTLSEITNGELENTQNVFIEVLDVSDYSLNESFNIKLVQLDNLGNEYSSPYLVTIYNLGYNQPYYLTDNKRLTYNGILTSS